MKFSTCRLCNESSQELDLNRASAKVQVHRHHWHDSHSTLFALGQKGVQIETVIEAWEPWDAFALRGLWTSSQLTLQLNKTNDIWRFLCDCPRETRKRVDFIWPETDRLPNEKALRLFLDVEAAFPEVRLPIAAVTRQFQIEHRLALGFFRVIGAIWPLRMLLWLPYILLCILQNSVSGNFSQLKTQLEGVQGRFKSTAVHLYWAGARGFSWLKLWRIPVGLQKTVASLKLWQLGVWIGRFWTWLGFWRIPVILRRALDRIALWRVTVVTQRFLTWLGLWRIGVWIGRGISKLQLWQIPVALKRIWSGLGLWRIGVWIGRIAVWIRRGISMLQLWQIPVALNRLWTWLGLWRIPVWIQRGVSHLKVWRISVGVARFWTWVGIWRVGVWSARRISQMELWRGRVLFIQTRMFIRRSWDDLALWRFRASGIRMYYRLNMVRIRVVHHRWKIYQIRWTVYAVVVGSLWLLFRLGAGIYFSTKYIWGRYLLKPYYMVRYQYDTRIRGAVNENNLRSGAL